MIIDLSRRRALIRLASAAAAGLVLPPALAQPVSDSALVAYVDGLLPGGDGLPAASALGIAPEIAALAQEGSLFARLLSAGTGWLDGIDPRGFAGLPADARTRVIDWMAAAPYDEVQGRFHHVVRLVACELYYARPEARAGLPLGLAPQPAGYPPPWGTG